MVETGKQMVRLTMEGLFVIADEAGAALSPGASHRRPGVLCWTRQKISGTANPLAELRRCRDSGSWGLPWAIPWGSSVTRPDTQTVLLEGGDPLHGAEQQAVLLTPPRVESAWEIPTNLGSIGRTRRPRCSELCDAQRHGRHEV